MVVKEINNSNYEAFTNLDLVAFSNDVAAVATDGILQVDEAHYIVGQ